MAAAAAAAVSPANTYFQQQIFQKLLQQHQQFQIPSHYQNYLTQHADSPPSTTQDQIHLQHRHTFQTASSALKQQPIVKQTIINKNNELDQVKEHFKRSLGCDCDELLLNKQKTLETTTTKSSNKNINHKKFTTSTIHTSSSSITKIKNLYVEDHFIKSLGVDYLKRIKKTPETVNSTVVMMLQQVAIIIKLFKKTSIRYKSIIVKIF